MSKQESIELYDNAAEKHLVQYSQMINGLMDDSKRKIDFGDYSGMTFAQTYSNDYVYCNRLLRLKPKTITMLLFQGYIQKMNFIYKPNVRVMCEQYSCMKDKTHSNKKILKAIKNK